MGFLATIAIGTLLLMLPLARNGADGAPFLIALFTATSATCVTGLVVVDTPTYWSGAGQGIILALIQIGGLGIMTGATMLGLLITRRLKLNRRVLAQAETKTFALGDVTSVLKLILITTVFLELLLALFLGARFLIGYRQSVPQAIANGVFHSISAFNNAGFARFSDSAMSFAGDPFVLVPLMLGIIVGGIGFPVIYELKRELLRPQEWSLHTKITLLGTLLLLLAGTATTLAFEWGNESTLGPMSVADKILNAVFHSVNTRTAGFNSMDIGQMQPETLFFSDALMLIGGGSASTAGGIKVGTFMVLGLIVWAEIRGEPDAAAYRRRLSGDVQRLALTVVLLALGVVATATMILLSVTDHDLSVALFETISAFATVGLSTGITADLPQPALYTLVVLMFVGRVGTVTAATALALQSVKRPYRYPEERPIVG